MSSLGTITFSNENKINMQMAQTLSVTESIMSQLDDLKRKDKMERLESSWRSLMSNMGQSDAVISTRTKKFPAHKNVLIGNKNM